MNSSFLFFFNHLTVIGFILATLILEKKISLLLLKVFHCVTGSLWIDEKNKQKRKKKLISMSVLTIFFWCLFRCRHHHLSLTFRCWVKWKKKNFFFSRNFYVNTGENFFYIFYVHCFFLIITSFFFILSEKLFFCLTSFSTLCWNDDETWNTPTHTPRKNTNKIMNVDDNKKNVTNTIYTPMNVCVCVKSIENFFFKI